MTSITDEKVAAWQEAALAPEIAGMLEQLRGWAGFALYDLGIGWNGNEVVIPSKGPDGTWAALYYQPDPAKRNGKPKLKARPGATRALWPPLDRPAGDDWTVFVEGESDAIAAYSAGLHVTGLPGASAWRSEWAERFADRRVAVIFDADKPGRKAAAQVAADLATYAAEVRIVELDVDGNDGYDLTDELLALGLRDDGPNAGNLLRRRIADTPSYQADPAADSPQPGDSWKPKNLLHSAADPPEPPVIGTAVYAGKRHIISGESESGKSWLALAWCLEVLRQGGNAAYVDHEMGETMARERLEDLGATPDEIGRLRYVEPDEPANFAPTQIADLVHNVALVIIDATIGSLGLHGLDDNSSTDIERWYQRVVDPLRASGAAVVVLDHVTKNPDTRGKYAIGSQRKVAACDVHLSVEAIAPFGRDRCGKAKVMVKKDRPGHLARPTLGTFTLDTRVPQPYQWEPYAGAQVVDPEGHFRPTVLMQRVSEYVERHGPVSKTQVEENVTGRAGWIRKAIDALLREEFIVGQEAIGQGGNRTELTSIRPFRDTPEQDRSQTDNEPRPRPSRPRPGRTTEPRPPLQGDGRSRDGVLEAKSVPLEEPCPACSSPTGREPHPTAGGTYCCHDCARGEACACKYTSDQEPRS